MPAARHRTRRKPELAAVEAAGKPFVFVGGLSVRFPLSESLLLLLYAGLHEGCKGK
jgi:hypothetical protein